MPYRNDQIKGHGRNQDWHEEFKGEDGSTTPVTLRGALVFNSAGARSRMSGRGKVAEERVGEKWLRAITLRWDCALGRLVQ